MNSQTFAFGILETKKHATQFRNATGTEVAYLILKMSLTLSIPLFGLILLYSLQCQHYQQIMPDVFHHLQELDEKRIKNIKNFMSQSVTIERNVFPIINKCLDGIVNAANAINEKEVRKTCQTASSDFFKHLGMDNKYQLAHLVVTKYITSSTQATVSYTVKLFRCVEFITGADVIEQSLIFSCESVEIGFLKLTLLQTRNVK